MERSERIFRKSENRRGDFENQKTYQKRLIIKNPKAKIYPKRDYLVILDDEEIILGYRYIKEIYIHKDSSLPFRFLLRLLEKKRVFFIDGFGNILGEVRIG